MSREGARAEAGFGCETPPGPAPRGRDPARVLLTCLLLTLGFAAVEAAAGLWSGSLALLSDAGHMVTDGAGLALAWLGARVAVRPPTVRFTYGLGRVEVVAAVANGLLLCGVVAWITVQAIGRLADPPPVKGAAAIGVATGGLVVNLLVARLLRRGGNSLNLRAAFLHVLGDLLGSLAAIASGALILTIGWLAADPILSLLICALILVSAFRVLKEGTGILLEGVPAHLDLEEVGRAIVSVPGVHSVHDLHLWQLSSHEAALSAHVVLREPREWEETIGRVRALLAERFGVHHATLEPSRVPEVSAEP